MNVISNPRDKSIQDIAREISGFDKSCNEVQKTELIDMKLKVTQLKNSIKEIIDNIEAIESGIGLCCSLYLIPYLQLNILAVTMSQGQKPT